jgi:exosortase
MARGLSERELPPARARRGSRIRAFPSFGAGLNLSAQGEPRPQPPARVDAVAALLAAACLGLALALCLPAIGGLGFVFERVEFYGHGYLVPIVAAYLAWGQRRAIARALREPRPPALGWLAVFAAATFEVLMLVGDVGFAAGLGISIVLAATAFAVGGTRLLRPLALPLGFLALMVPPPRFVLYELLPRVKLAVTHAAVWILQSADVTVLAEGNQILLPGRTLFVADACSGLTSVVTMLPIACVLAYFLTHGAWRRLAVVASVLPLAIGANVLRVVVTVLLVSHIGIDAAQGSLHESFGLATYVLGTLCLVGIARLLR